MKRYKKRPHNKLLLDTIGEAFRFRREELGYSLREFSSIMDTSVIQIQKVENGLTDLRITKFNKFLEALELKVSDIL